MQVAGDPVPVREQRQALGVAAPLGELERHPGLGGE